MLIHEQTINQEAKFEMRTGDVIFVKNEQGITSKAIKLLTGSYFVHAAILIELKGLWFVIEARSNKSFGYQMMPIEWWLARYKDEDAYLGKMPKKKNLGKCEDTIRNVVLDSMECTRPYRIKWLALVYFLQEWVGIFRPEISNLFNGDRPLVCSTLVQEAWERAGIISQQNYMSPGALVKKIGGEKALVPLKPKYFIMSSRLKNASNDDDAAPLNYNSSKHPQKNRNKTSPHFRYSH